MKRKVSASRQSTRRAKSLLTGPGPNREDARSQPAKNSESCAFHVVRAVARGWEMLGATHARVTSGSREGAGGTWKRKRWKGRRGSSTDHAAIFILRSGASVG